ncbi:MAG: JAB domain-containing protein [Phenylobacterium sp.]
MGAETRSSPPAIDLEDLRERAFTSGPESLATVECLALLLRRGAGRAAPGWAERLLERFGSLPELLGASSVDLQREAPPALALQIRLLHDLQRRALEAPLRQRPILGSRSSVSAYLRTVLAAEAREQFRALFLDRRHRLISDEIMGHGTVDHAPAYPREILRRALERNAAGVVLVRNSASADPQPSAADVDLARQVITAGRTLRIALHDHLLVAGEDIVSFRQFGLL